MYVFVGTSDYLPSADKWLLCIYCIILANTLLWLFLYMLSCINNNDLNKTKSKNYIGLFATKSAPPMYIIYVHEKLRTSKI